MSTFEAKNLTVSRQNGPLPRVPFLDIKERVLGKSYELSISFVEERGAKTLNKKFRKKDYVPNTLSFSLTKTSGEIVMCINAIRKEYKKFDMTLRKYTIFLLIHSMLHLKGMRHGSTMEGSEANYLSWY